MFGFYLTGVGVFDGSKFSAEVSIEALPCHLIRLQLFC
jgi:hypothetical protein